MKQRKTSREKDNKTDRIGIRVTPEEKKKLEELAESHHISTSKLVVDLVIGQTSLHNEKACDIADVLCQLAYEVGYIKGVYPDCKEDLKKIEGRCVEIWQSLR